jgi:hypothetical protein
MGISNNFIFIFTKVVNDGVHPVFYWLNLTMRGKPALLTFGNFDQGIHGKWFILNRSIGKVYYRIQYNFFKTVE